MQHPRRLAVALALLVPVALLARAGAAQSVPDPAAPVTVFVVRHAEDLAAPGVRDPGLSAAGKERAHDLAKLLEHAGVTHLYCSEYERTAATLAPLAEATGLAVEARAARDGAALVEALRALPHGAVAGHSNTVPDVVRGLGGPELVLEHTEHGRLFVVHVPKTPHAKPRALELRYGD